MQDKNEFIQQYYDFLKQKRDRVSLIVGIILFFTTIYMSFFLYDDSIFPERIIIRVKNNVNDGVGKEFFKGIEGTAAGVKTVGGKKYNYDLKIRKVTRERNVTGERLTGKICNSEQCLLLKNVPFFNASINFGWARLNAKNNSFDKTDEKVEFIIQRPKSKDVKISSAKMFLDSSSIKLLDDVVISDSEYNTFQTTELDLFDDDKKSSEKYFQDEFFSDITSKTMYYGIAYVPSIVRKEGGQTTLIGGTIAHIKILKDSNIFYTFWDKVVNIVNYSGLRKNLTIRANQMMTNSYTKKIKMVGNVTIKQYKQDKIVQLIKSKSAFFDTATNKITFNDKISIIDYSGKKPRTINSSAASYNVETGNLSFSDNVAVSDESGQPLIETDDEIKFNLDEKSGSQSGKVIPKNSEKRSRIVLKF